MPLQQLTECFPHVRGAVVVIDRAGVIREWTRGATELLGYAREDALGRACADVLGGVDAAGRLLCTENCELFKRLDLGEDLAPFTMTVHGKTGRTLPVTCSVMTIDGADGPYLVYHLHPLGEHAVATGTLDPARGMMSPAPGVEARPLTRREREVLKLLAEGTAPEQIADRLHIRPTTARNHIQAILRKLGVHSRLEAVVYAYRSGLI